MKTSHGRAIRIVPMLAMLAMLTFVVATAGCGVEPYDSAAGGGGDDASTASPPDTSRPDGPTDGGAADAPASDASSETPIDPPPPTLKCATTFRFTPPEGKTYKTVEVTGEWNVFVKPGVEMKGDGKGGYEAKVDLRPGVVAYKLLLDGAYELDPGGRMRKYVDGIENSAVRVADCRNPTLTLATKALARPAGGQGSFTAVVAYTDGIAKSALDPVSVRATLRRDDTRAPIAKVSADAAKGISLEVSELADGKYTVIVEAKDKAGRGAHPLKLVFWIEAEAFDWRDAVIYMAMTDRLKNGDTTKSVKPVPGVDPRADFMGGDLRGVRDVIRSGALDKLGIRALWLTPFNTNPSGAQKADDGVHLVTGYHGYWPVKAREVDARIGGAKALAELVAEAHKHGIRVLQDYVANHIHKEHEYFSAHPSWFRTGCICGTTGCGWTEHRLDCLFAEYLPDVNWTVPDLNEQFTDDALWWLDTFDLDGFRIDAVKHVEDAAIINLSAKVRDELEAAGTKVFLTGETAMGWDDCDAKDPKCNAENYGTISRYIGPNGLDGQLDFVLHHAVPRASFDYSDRGMIHADYWTQASGWRYPKGAIMTPYVGSHDTPRAVTWATYRGQSGYPRSTPDHKWDDIAKAPSGSEPYQRLRLSLAWLLGLPGAPLLYYGDEYGEWGGADPNNRAMWRGDGALSEEEKATRTLVEKVGTARKELVALRRGEYLPVYNASEDVLVYARKAGAGEVALVALSRSTSSRTVTFKLPAALGVADGTSLRDRIGGNTVRVAGDSVTLTLDAWGAMVLAP